MSKKWVKKPINEKLANQLQKETGLAPLTAKLLCSKGIETMDQARSFLRPNFAKELHNPFSLTGIQKVVERINKAIEEGERIIIHGDYDADGVTTTALFVKAFEMLGKEVDYYVPNRFKDGYGVNIRNVEMLSQYDLVITGDTGIKEFQTIHELTKTYKTDVIVTDHHEPLVLPVDEKDRFPENTRVIEREKEVMALPNCYEVINPKRIDCSYPEKNLSGAGVAFKVMEALFDYRKHPKRGLYDQLDMVASGLVPDLVPMFDLERNSFEVRNLVKIGLRIMNTAPKQWVLGIQSLRKKPRMFDSTDLGFTIGPLLNAVGRLYDPKPAVDYLLENEEKKSYELITYLNEVNLERRKLSKEISKKVIKELKNAPEEEKDFGIVVTAFDLHEGITGLVASDVLSEFYRTTIAFAPIEDKETGKKLLKGSARSIDGIHVLQALIDVEKEMGPYKYGGHVQAAGLTIEEKDFETFKKLFREACKKQAEASKDENLFHPKKYYDLEVKLEEVTEKFIAELNHFEPYGFGNDKPIFLAKQVDITKLKPIGEDGQYVQFRFYQNGTYIDGVTFSGAKDIIKSYQKGLMKSSNVPCDILFYPQINDFNKRPQLLVEEINIYT